ncbi:MAG: prolipoprotein diacylglyceryl transferase [Cryomorphaceae bacterium]|jgi:prolipoprotein diacylglyceryl transferase|nr:prolipoprotein diacylglyceryl transferase [Cryomorphaceae bacterium]MBT3689552.1 prolipoprotein diacylglyceryl transferase [Cryomorphaceae bacterium]MBT4221957.1 prolipoprotein diacylglyceryl transferase [Cryomorphaceae bacterium]MBT4293564.1 prolipoprotein diacylglyceryl transferase [Cryomorphaceae bacterium]MBT4517630.1 prolipoprotein diacylglyceryl transferase [Cryomorphaceae bacterium]
MIISQIKWSPSETLFEIGGFSVYVYSLMFILAFLTGYSLVKSFFIKENVDEKYLDPMLIYMVVSVFLGARFGEVFFYQWGYYQTHLIEILLPIQESSNSSILGLIDGYKFTGFRGLASHGAAIGIFIGLLLFKRKYNFKSLLWIFDRLTIPIAIGGAFVRIGNFFNSEILGKYTDSNWGVIFENRGETLPRHPAQLYESFGYIILFIILYKLYQTSIREKEGTLFGYFLIGLFSIRFVVEFMKESQGGIETFLPGLSTGQWLSIPFIIIGIIFLFIKKKKTLV